MKRMNYQEYMQSLSPARPEVRQERRTTPRQKARRVLTDTLKVGLPYALILLALGLLLRGW